MISMKELNPHDYKMDKETSDNLDALHLKLNEVRKLYGKSMVVTSGLRSQADQARINPKVSKSKHLTGQAADILDKDGDLWRWIMVNMDKMVELGFYFEDKSATPIWVHFQIVPPKSGRRIFKP
jgi:uncharacterized protein YcbK (DUF882 family)